MPPLHWHTPISTTVIWFRYGENKGPTFVSENHFDKKRQRREGSSNNKPVKQRLQGKNMCTTTGRVNSRVETAWLPQQSRNEFQLHVQDWKVNDTSTDWNVQGQDYMVNLCKTSEMKLDSLRAGQRNHAINGVEGKHFFIVRDQDSTLTSW